MSRCTAYSPFMKHNKFPQDQNQMPAGVTQPSAADLSRNAIDFVPLPDEVARKAYFSYVNQGSLPGCDVQHWLDAEVQLLAERQLTQSQTAKTGQPHFQIA